MVPSSRGKELIGNRYSGWHSNFFVALERVNDILEQVNDEGIGATWYGVC